MNTREDDERPPAARDNNYLTHYEIRINGHLDPRWSTWFDGLRLDQQPDGTTTIRGSIPDQAALHGVLQKVRDLGLELLSVVRQDPNDPTTKLD